MKSPFTLLTFPEEATSRAATWLRPFRGWINFSSGQWEIYCATVGSTIAIEHITITLRWLEFRGWILGGNRPGLYRVQPFLFLHLPADVEAERVYVHYFQTLARMWFDKTEEGSPLDISNDFALIEYENLRHALDLAMKFSLSIEYLIAAIDTADRIQHKSGHRVRRLENLVSYFEAKVSADLTATERFDYIGCLDLLANAYRMDQQRERAETMYRRVLISFNALEQQPVFEKNEANTALYNTGRSTTLIHLSGLARERGNWIESRQYWEEALRLARAVGVAEPLADALWEAGIWHKAQREYRDSEEAFQKAIATTRDRFKKGQILVNLAALAEDMGDVSMCLQYNQQALEIFEYFSEEAPLGQVYTNMGLAYERSGDWESSAEFGRKAIEWHLRYGDWFNAGQCYQNLGNLYFHQRDLPAASEYFKKAKEAYQRAEAPLLEAEIWQNEAEVCRFREHYAEAISNGEKAAALFRKHGSSAGEASAWLHVGNALVQDEREDEAVLVYETARQLYILARHASGQGLISQNLAEIARRKGDYSLGGKHLMDAAECFCRPEALEHLPRLIAYTNVFARFFDNKEIMDRMAALLTEHLTETVLLQLLRQARTLYEQMM